MLWSVDFKKTKNACMTGSDHVEAHRKQCSTAESEFSCRGRCLSFDNCSAYDWSNSLNRCCLHSNNRITAPKEFSSPCSRGGDFDLFEAGLFLFILSHIHVQINICCYQSTLDLKQAWVSFQIIRRHQDTIHLGCWKFIERTVCLTQTRFEFCFFFFAGNFVDRGQFFLYVLSLDKNSVRTRSTKTISPNNGGRM